MKTLKALLLILLIGSLQTIAQNLNWAKQFGNSLDEESQSIVVDAGGNVYIFGSFGGSCDFDPGTGTFSLTSAGSYDIFLNKLDASGNFIWAKRIGGPGQDKAKSMVIDGSGNLLITGTFNGTVDFDPNSSITLLSSAGQTDIFICKFDASGNLIWANSFGNSGFDYIYAIATDVSGNVYTTGSYLATTDFDPSASVYNLVNVGNHDVFVSKLNSSGSFVWAKSLSGSLDEAGYGISTDVAGNVLITGHFYGTVDFDPSSSTSNITSNGLSDVFIEKLDASGNLLWTKTFGSTFSDFGYAVRADASGNIYSSGYFLGTADLDPGPGTFTLTSPGGLEDIYLQKLDQAGNFIWAKQLGGASGDYCTAMCLDASSNVYLTGFFNGTCDFDPGPATYSLTSAGSHDVYICKIDASGNFGWAVQFACPGLDLVYGLDLDASGNVYATGSFKGVCDFDSSISTYTLASYLNSHDVFTVKLSNTPLLISSNEDFMKDIILFPNPSTGIININTEIRFEKFSIYNMLGMKIMEQDLEENSPIDIRHIQNGIYSIEFSTKEVKKTRRFVVSQ